MPFPIQGPHAERAERLWSVYALERGTDQTTPAVSFAIAAVSITYVATTLAFLLTRPAGGGVPFAIEAILPIVPIGLYTSLVLQNRTTQIRNYILNSIERELRRLDYLDVMRVDQAVDGSLPTPAFRLWSVNSLMEEKFGWKTVSAALIHPYSLAAIFVEFYNIFVLMVYGEGRWYEVVVMSLYTLFILGGVFELVRGRNYLFGKPDSRFRTDVPAGASWISVVERSSRGRQVVFRVDDAPS